MLRPDSSQKSTYCPALKDTVSGSRVHLSCKEPPLLWSCLLKKAHVCWLNKARVERPQSFVQGRKMMKGHGPLIAPAALAEDCLACISSIATSAQSCFPAPILLHLVLENPSPHLPPENPAQERHTRWHFSFYNYYLNNRNTYAKKGINIRLFVTYLFEHSQFRSELSHL